MFWLLRLVIIINQFNRHMDHRAFGKEITNLMEADLHRYKRNYSFLNAERVRDHSLHISKGSISTRMCNKSYQSKEEKKVQEIKVELEDPQMVPDYFSDAIHFMKLREKQTFVPKNYIIKHSTVNDHSRGKLIDWLSELHYKFKMFPETIFAIVSLLDQYLCAKSVPLCQLQLVGVSCLFIAAKFEETYQVPQLKQLVTCCAGQYTIAQILEREADIIKELNFELIVNSSYKFFEPLSKVIGLEPKNHHLAQYVLELSLLQPKFLCYSPSLMASAAIYLIKKIRKSESSWDEVMTSIVGFKENQLKACARELCNVLETANELENTKSMKKKFSLPAFHEVTRIKLQRKEKK